MGPGPPGAHGGVCALPIRLSFHLDHGCGCLVSALRGGVIQETVQTLQVPGPQGDLATAEVGRDCPRFYGERALDGAGGVSG